MSDDGKQIADHGAREGPVCLLQVERTGATYKAGIQIAIGRAHGTAIVHQNERQPVGGVLPIDPSTVQVRHWFAVFNCGGGCFIGPAPFGNGSKSLVGWRRRGQTLTVVVVEWI